MTNKELLRAIITEIDLIMHDKDYRFPESENTWYSRESCKVLTPEEVFEELRTELRQLAKIEDDFADLEAKLAEKEKELAYMTKQAKKFNNEAQKYYEDAYCNSFQNQKAITELEKVKDSLKHYVCESIDYQIQELKGDNDEPRQSN